MSTTSSNRVIHWFKFSSPATFYPLAGKLIPFFWVLTVLFGIAGLWISFFVAPVDAVQGQGYRIIFVHVPASWMSMFIYIVMAVWAGLGLVFNTRLSAMMAQALAPHSTPQQASRLIQAVPYLWLTQAVTKFEKLPLHLRFFSICNFTLTVSQIALIQTKPLWPCHRATAYASQPAPARRAVPQVVLQSNQTKL